MHLRRHEIDLTQGVIWKQLVRFALPLLIGNLFQQMYNTVDSIVVGRYVGKEALAAVGMVGSAINALIGFFIGIAAGAGVVISQFCGAKDDKRLSDAVQTTMLMALFACALCTVAGVLAVPLLLNMMNTPADAYDLAHDYLSIYFAGVSGMLIYNVGAGILRAVGDSRRPLYFLCLTTLLNTGLDMLFVVALNMSVRGVALATIISQFVSAALVLIVLTRSDAPYRIRWRALKLDKPILKHVLRIGLPAAIQSSITSISNVFVQSYINAFGSGCAAGWTAYGRLDQFALLPLNSLSISSTTFVGQNLGAGDVKRAKRGASTSMWMAAFVCVAMIAPMLYWRHDLISIFNSDPQVLYYGGVFLQMMSPFYLLCAINQIYAGALRGAGVSRAPMVIMLMSFVAFRQLYLFVCSRLSDSFRVIALAYPMGWILCSALILIYFFRSDWEHRYTLVVESNKQNT